MKIIITAEIRFRVENETTHGETNHRHCVPGANIQAPLTAVLEKYAENW
jgi:hypothetical protein